MAPRLFDVAWEELDVAAVERFLADAGPGEALTWEAKGTDAPHPGTIKKAVCGFANSIGGYLIIGAEHGQSGWTFPGVAFRSPEPGTWLSSVITSGLDPVPRFDIRAWEIAGDRHGVVVSVDQVAVPPCMTSDGVVFERTSGQTRPVTDQSELARLLESGVSARQRAVRAATARLELTAKPHPKAEQQWPLIALALAPTGVPDELESRIFSRAFAQGALRELTSPHLHVGPLVLRVWQTEVSKDGLTAGLWGHDATWAASVTLDGVAAFAYSSWGQQASIDDLMRTIRGAWTAGIELTVALGLAPPSYLVLEAFPGRESITIDRWIPTMDAPTDDQFASVQRAIQRARGEPIWEPEIDPGSEVG